MNESTEHEFVLLSQESVPLDVSAVSEASLYAIEESPGGSTTLVVYGESVRLSPPLLRQMVEFLQARLSAVEADHGPDGDGCAAL